MDIDGPFGERALLLFTVIRSEAISVLYKDELESVSSPELLLTRTRQNFLNRPNVP
jgi:hypothetical protein